MHGLPGNDAGDEVLLQPMAQEKCHHGPQGQADGGVGQAQGHAEEVAAQEAGGLPGDGRENYLEGLDGDEQDGRQGPAAVEGGLDCACR